MKKNWINIIIFVMFIAYFLGGYQIFPIGGYGVTSLDILTLLLFTVFFKRILWDAESIVIPKHPALLFLGLMILFPFISGLSPLIDGSADQIGQYFKSSAHYFFLVGFTALCSVYRIDDDIWERVIKLWLILALLINVFGVYQIVARAFDWPLAWIDMTNISLTGGREGEAGEYKQLSLRFKNFYRATSIFSEPSALAAFNLYIFTFLLIPFVQGYKQFLKNKTLTILVFISSLVSLFLAFSMTGIVGIGIILFFVYLLHRSRRLILVSSLLGVSFLLILITDSAVKTYANVSVVELSINRVQGILSGNRSSKSMAGESFSGRTKNAEIMVETWEKNPLIGTGIGLTQSATENEIKFSDYSFLAALVETGILGAIAFLGMFISLFLFSYKFVGKKRIEGLSDKERRLYGLLFFIMLIQFMINYVSANNLIAYPLWNVLAMVYSLINGYYIKNNKEVYKINFLKVGIKHKFIRQVNEAM